MKRLITEPLVHFALIGAVIFAVYSIRPQTAAPRDNEIVVSTGMVEHLAAIYTRTWQRPPTRIELEGLINEHVRDEAAYREGVAIGLDRDDSIVRRRIRQKFEFIAQDLVAQVQPTEDELAAYLSQHPENFRVPAHFNFRQVFLDPNKHAGTLDADASKLITALNNDDTLDPLTLGDRTIIDHAYKDVSILDMHNLFGGSFAANFANLNPGSWQGPIHSAYGAHLVRIDERSAERLPDLPAIRGIVRREWENTQRNTAIERFYNELLDRYTITIQWPKITPPEDDE